MPPTGRAAAPSAQSGARTPPHPSQSCHASSLTRSCLWVLVVTAPSIILATLATTSDSVTWPVLGAIPLLSFAVMAAAGQRIGSAWLVGAGVLLTVGAWLANVELGLVVGLAVAAGSAIIFTILDNSWKQRKGARSMTGIPGTAILVAMLLGHGLAAYASQNLAIDVDGLLLFPLALSLMAFSIPSSQGLTTVAPRTLAAVGFASAAAGVVLPAMMAAGVPILVRAWQNRRGARARGKSS